MGSRPPTIDLKDTLGYMNCSNYCLTLGWPPLQGVLKCVLVINSLVSAKRGGKLLDNRKASWCVGAMNLCHVRQWRSPYFRKRWLDKIANWGALLMVSQLALQQTTLLRIVNVRQVQVQLACRTRKEREGFTRLWGTAIICHRQQKVSQRHTAARTPVVAFTLPTARREIFNRGVDSDPAEFQLIRLSRRKLWRWCCFCKKR